MRSEVGEAVEKRPKLYSSVFRHYLSETYAASPTGCARSGSGDEYAALPAAERQRHEDAASSIKEAIKLEHRGYAPSKKNTPIDRFS